MTSQHSSQLPSPFCPRPGPHDAGAAAGTAHVHRADCLSLWELRGLPDHHRWAWACWRFSLAWGQGAVQAMHVGRCGCRAFGHLQTPSADMCCHVACANSRAHQRATFWPHSAQATASSRCCWSSSAPPRSPAAPQSLQRSAAPPCCRSASARAWAHSKANSEAGFSCMMCLVAGCC